MNYPEPLERLIKQFAQLPGVGIKSAQRFAFSVLDMTDEEAQDLAEAVTRAKSSLHPCRICGAYTSNDDECEICADPARTDSIICVVESAKDVFYMSALQSGYNGKYHVLGGSLSPMDGITPDDLNLQSLAERAKSGKVSEVIIATNPDVEGEATASYIAHMLKPMNVKVTRIAYGMPIGSNLEFVDAMTLSLAMEGRREIND